jgi:serine/threonine protein kinase/lipopolysaccharide biosynthesis regulator YciM
MYLPQGTELNNRYVIESLLGHGGFGITYAAHDKILNVRVAVKEYLPRQLATRSEGQTKVSVFTGEARQHYDYGLRKFLEEAQSVARFAHHPNVVSARDYFEANGTAYMVMEYVEGVTLKEYVEKKGGRISFEEAKGIMMPVMDALREVHQAGMLHRDVSPDNIYITTSAQVKILDFGAARYFAGEQSKSLSVILKPGYAPEEQYRSSGKQGAWTDVYAVGATIYKALTGKTPPDALDRKEEDTLEPPSRLGVSIPPPAEQALFQALAVNAAQRFQNMGEFQQALTGGEPMTMGFQRGPVSFQPAPEPSYTPGSAPVSASPPVSAQPTSHPSQQPSQYPQLPRRSANPAVIAAGIGAGVIGLALVVVLVWIIFIRPPGGDNPEKLLKQGISYVQAQDYPQAQLALEKARGLAPNDARIHLQLAKTYHGLKQYSEELKACQEVIRLDPANVEAPYLLGMEYIRQGKKDLAQQEYLQIKDKKPVELGQQLFAAIYPPSTPQIKNARELLVRGMAYYKAQNYTQAEAALKESVNLNPQEAVAYSYLGLTYAGLNRLPEAIGAYRQAINLKADFSEAYLNLGAAYEKSEKPEDAIEAWKASIRHKPDLWEAYYNLAAIYWRRGQKDLAMEQYKLLQDKDPVQARSLQEKIPDLARYASQIGQPPPGPSTTLSLTPPGDVAKDVLARGRDYYQAKDFAKAREALAEVVKLSPQEAEAHYLLGLTNASLKPPLDALSELRQAVELKPDTYTWSNIGAELAKLDRTKEAAEAFKEALKANPNDAEVRYQLGEAYVKLGEVKQARDEQKVLKDQDPEKAKQLLASIDKRKGGGGGRSLERQIDEEAKRIRMRRGEIPPTGARATKAPAPPRTQQPPPKPAPPTPQAGVGWRIEKRGEVQR